MRNHAEDFGMSFDNLQYDWKKVISRSRNVSDKLAGGIEFLFKKNKVDYVLGTGKILEKGKVEVEGTDGQQQILESDHVLVATGCKTRDFPDLPFNGKSVVGSSEAMVMENQPKDIIIIGAGAIGVEFAYFFNAFGTKVTIVEMMPNILPVEDQEVSAELEKSFKKSGIEILSSTKVIETKDLGNGVEITIQGDGSDARIINAEVALIAIGVAPVLPADFEVDLDRGYIVTDDNYQTSAPGIYAVGIYWSTMACTCG